MKSVQLVPTKTLHKSVPILKTLAVMMEKEVRKILKHSHLYYIGSSRIGLHGVHQRPGDSTQSSVCGRLGCTSKCAYQNSSTNQTINPYFSLHKHTTLPIQCQLLRTLKVKAKITKFSHAKVPLELVINYV